MFRAKFVFTSYMIVVTFLVPLFFGSCTDKSQNSGGPSTETENVLSLLVVDTAGKPMIGARIQVRALHYLPSPNSDTLQGILEESWTNKIGVSKIILDSGFQDSFYVIQVLEKGQGALKIISNITSDVRLQLEVLKPVRGWFKKGVQFDSINPTRIGVHGSNYSSSIDATGSFFFSAFPVGQNVLLGICSIGTGIEDKCGFPSHSFSWNSTLASEGVDTLIIPPLTLNEDSFHLISLPKAGTFHFSTANQIYPLLKNYSGFPMLVHGSLELKQSIKAKSLYLETPGPGRAWFLSLTDVMAGNTTYADPNKSVFLGLMGIPNRVSSTQAPWSQTFFLLDQTINSDTQLDFINPHWKAWWYFDSSGSHGFDSQLRQLAPPIIVGTPLWINDSNSLSGGAVVLDSGSSLRIPLPGLRNAQSIHLRVHFWPDQVQSQSSVVQDLSRRFRMGWGPDPADSAVKILVTQVGYISTPTWEGPRQKLRQWHDYELCVNLDSARIRSRIDTIALVDTILGFPLESPGQDTIELGGTWGGSFDHFHGRISSLWIGLDGDCGESSGYGANAIVRIDSISQSP